MSFVFLITLKYVCPSQKRSHGCIMPAYRVCAGASVFIIIMTVYMRKKNERNDETNRIPQRNRKITTDLVNCRLTSVDTRYASYGF